MNKVEITGRLTKDTEIRYSQGNNTAIARNTIAVNRRGQATEGGQTADFISILAFGKTAEFLEKYGNKGVKFEIVGRIQTGSYTNKDGAKVYTTEVVVEQIEFAESKSGNAGTSAPAASQNVPDPAPDDQFMTVPDDIAEELPFN